MRKLSPIFFATLLVFIVTCEKAHFVHRTDGSAAGGAAGGGSGGVTGGAGGVPGGTGGASGKDGGSGGTGTGTGGAGGSLCSLTAQACSRQPGQMATDPCDPVCQSGTCPCGQKCSYAGIDAKPVCAVQGAKTELESCTVTYSGLSSQHDNCVPGTLCLAPGSGQFAYCFRLCYQDSDCLSYADCSQRPLSSNGGVVSVCSPAHQQCGVADKPCCDPLNASSNPCPSTNPICFLVAPDGAGHSRTVCEFSTGGVVDDSTTSCTSPRDCMANLTCAEEDHLCHRVCDLAKPVCPTGLRCKSWGTEYGYCVAN